MTGIQNTYNYDGSVYVQRSIANETAGFWTASAVSGAIMSTLPLYSKPFLKQMKAEHANNKIYKDSFIKAVEASGLKEKELVINHMHFSNADKLIPEKDIVCKDIKAGLNACYVPNLKEIRLNIDKASIAGFHELGHAFNHLNSKLGKCLQKFRNTGYVIAGLMGTVALFSRRKPKEAKKNAVDFVTDNCGKIAFAAMLPIVAEEALASYNGIKFAKQGGLGADAIKNLKKFYGKALMSYAGYAAATGLSVFAASKITEIFTRPKKVKNPAKYY